MNWAFVIMAERSARLACSLAAWMSLLFCRASSIACFRVRETAELPADGASCARAVKGAEKSNGTSRTSKKELAFELVKPVLVMRAPFCSFSLKTGGPSKLPLKLGVNRVITRRTAKLLVTQGFNWLQARGLVRRQVAEKKPGGTGNREGNDHA